MNNINIQNNEFNTIDQKINTKNNKELSNELILENPNFKFRNKNKTIVQNTSATNRNYNKFFNKFYRIKIFKFDYK